jgi:hypothetical protein
VAHIREFMHFGLNTYSLVALMDRARSARGTSLAKQRRAKRMRQSKTENVGARFE